MSKKEKVLELLKSGNFTIAYHDNGVCDLYEGKHKYDDLGDLKPIKEFDCDFDGYLPKEVAVLVSALGGKAISI